MKKTKLTRSLMAACSIVALSAVMYGCAHSGGDDAPDEPVVDMPDTSLMDAQDAAMDAATAADTAADTAEAAVAAQMDNQQANSGAYALANEAARTARAAANAAQDASDDAAATMDTGEAEAAQAIAVAKQGEAEAARDHTVRLAGDVQMSQDALDNAGQEATALAAARTAASGAADAAKMAYEAAEKAVAAVEASQDAAQDSYDAAVVQRNAAHQAYMDAMSASDSAAMAGSSGDAEMYRDTAVEKQGEAVTAQGHAMTYAGKVSDADTERTALSLAKMKADEAAGMAEAAYERAKTAAAAVAGSETATDEAKADAQSASINARIAAKLARDASDRAQTAMDSEDAEAEQIRAEAHQENAEGYRNTATGIETVALEGDSDAEKLEMAQTGAMKAHTNASQHATDARQAADDVATLLGDTHPSATTAADEAKKAEDARDEAERLSGLADATDDPDMAAGYRKKAEDQETAALTALGQAKHYLTLANVGVGASETQQIAASARQAGRHANAAEDHYDDAKASAASAQGEVNKANASVTKAMRARTDVTNARKHLMTAMTARTAANTARDNAKQAWDDAVAARESARTSTSVIVAEDHVDTAFTAERTARDENDTAEGKAGEAMAAATSAETSANTHVLGLFILANAGLAAEADADVSESDLAALIRVRKSHRKQISEEIALAADSGDAEITDNSHDTTAVTSVLWPYYASLGNDNDFGGEGVDADTGPGEGKPTITITIDVTPYAMIHADPGDDEEEGTDDDVEANFTVEESLGDFAHAKEISVDAGDPGEETMRTRVLVFTDKEQANAPTGETTATLVNIPVSASRIETLGTPVNDSQNYDAGEYDHDGNSGTDTLTGMFTCADEASCSITVVDGEVQSISGYRFTSAADEVIVAAVASTEDASYLAFGVWMQDDADEATLANRYDFGAFAGGGTIADSTPVTLEGKATYRGSAAGVKATESRVDFFSADATLTANFGDDDDEATLSGKIHNIVAGGESVAHDIYLDALDGNVGDNGNFDASRARMGDGETGTDGNVTYPSNGTWSAQFYNPATDDEATDDVTEGPTNTAPGSVAGTFGVTMPDNPSTRDTSEETSFVGAFGAHKD